MINDIINDYNKIIITTSTANATTTNTKLII